METKVQRKLVICTKFQVNQTNCVESRRGGGGGVKKSRLSFVFIIPNPSLDFSYVVLNFWPNLCLVVLIKLLL